MSSETKAPQPPAEAQPERYACNGPEGTFWTDDAALANKLIGAAFDRDEWTVTDTQNPTGAAPPPNAPVGVEGLSASLREARERMIAALGSRFGEAFDGDFDVMRDAADALAQHPAAVFRNDGNSEADFIADDAIACTACGGSGHRDDQQPAAVAPVGVEGLVGNWQARAEMERAESKNKEWAEWMRENHAGAASAFATCASQLEQALAQQPAAVDGGVSYPTPRNRQEAAALAGLALAYLGVTRAHIDAVIARCETDLAAQQGGRSDDR